jgi:hypothetical protein
MLSRCRGPGANKMNLGDDDHDRRARTAAARVAKILEEEGAQAQALFDRITKRHGLQTAKLLFERCIKLAKGPPSNEEEQEQRTAEKTRAKAAQSARALTKLPTLEQIPTANRDQLCDWYYRWPDRELKKKEHEVYTALLQRYVEVGGYPKDFNPNRLTPIKKRGSVMRNSPNAELPRLFEEEKAKHGGELTKAAFVKIHADRTGEDPGNIRKKLGYYLKRKT